MNLEAMIIYYCTAYLGNTAQYNVCQFFLFARLHYMQETILLKKYERGEVKQFVCKIPKIQTKTECLRTSNANVQYNSISEHD